MGMSVLLYYKSPQPDGFATADLKRWTPKGGEDDVISGV